MTREEAIEELSNYETEYGFHPNDVYAVVNKVYDDFEQQLKEAQATIEDLESQRFALWMLLDNIDTAEDIAKSDDKLFRALCRNEYQNRWSIFKPKDKE